MLFIKRPTATTVLYTVSTQSPAKTWTTRVATYLFLMLRIVVGLFVVTMLLLWYRKSWSAGYSAGRLSQIEDIVFSSALGRVAMILFDSIGHIYWMPLCFALTWLILRKAYTEESLLVIRGLGVQTSTSSRSYLGTSSTRFIPTTHIQDIFIHEAFKGFEVRFYLSIVVEGEEDVVVVFPVS